MITDKQIISMFRSEVSNEGWPSSEQLAATARQAQIRRRRSRLACGGAAVAVVATASTAVVLNVGATPSPHTREATRPHAVTSHHQQSPATTATSHGHRFVVSPLSGCGAPSEPEIVGHSYASGPPPVIYSDGSIALPVDMTYNRAGTAAALQVVLGKPGTVLSTDPNGALSSSNPINAITQIALAAAVGSRGSVSPRLQLTASGLAPGLYPIFGIVTYTDVTACGGYRAVGAVESSELATVQVS